MDRGAQKSPRRTTKFVHGDHITRSEYNDGVLRNNNRATNRLSREMQMYEKAQKVIMKDLGKETQLLRAKLTNTTITSPRMALTKNTNAVIEPFTVYGMSANPTSKRNKSKISLRPVYPSTIEHATPSVSGGIVTRSGFNSRNSALDSRSSILELRNGTVDSRNSLTESRNGLLEPVVNEATSTANGGFTSRKTGSRTRKLGSTRNNSIISSKMRNASVSSKPEISLSTDGAEMSLKDKRGSTVSAFSDNMSKINITPPESRVSFIDILADVEERKTKETEMIHRQRSENHVLRPRSPQLMADFEKTGDFANHVDEHDTRRRLSQHNVTPEATHFNIPRDY